MRRRFYLCAQARAHVAEAEANYRLYARLLEANQPDWALTLLFYSALHLVQAYAEQEAIRPGAQAAPTDHQARRCYVSERLGSVFAAYRTLQEGSEAARYDLVKRTGDAVRLFHDNHYARLREALRGRGIEFADDPEPTDIAAET